MPFVAGYIYWITFNFIVPPHEKISLCVCPERPLFFWINTNPKPHGIGQLAIPKSMCAALAYDSYLDLSGVKTGPVSDLSTARQAGSMSDLMKVAVLAELSQPIALLPDNHRNLALANLA